MATRMLIDARHPEETRVAVLKGNRIEEFDFESADKKQIKGNIYLAKVTRVEPSLQAAFVDFGGNRHGFLAFSEIHPDYYQIPKADREALLAEEAAHAEEEAALRADEDTEDALDDDHEDDEDEDGGLTEVDTSRSDRVSTIEAGHVENGDDDGEGQEADAQNQASDDGEQDAKDEDETDGRSRRRGRRQGRGRSRAADDLHARRMALRRRYKIQDVIHRRQVLLVQVVKEERGNKGAALTSYLSLAGRYCVLMPNSSHGGGISRKINSASDRKRLKAIVNELALPKSMGCIVRTAGLSRTKTEIKRDFDYLARLWDDLRETTLGSSAPALIHSDSDLIKRAIRDIYNREIEEVIVEGEDGYRAAKDFMKLLMPSHARRVKSYADPVPLFQRHGAEDQLTAMYDPVVQLKSGGYIVINPTEALVSIDINSGRATKEHGIEATAVGTNVEAAHEIARQLRLRDMAGLVVIDFIDMEYSSNIRKVEKAMKESLKNDRARIQVGRISSFGLLEMSRQRLRTGVLEATTRECPHCDGTGLVRTASSAGLSALRLIEDEAAKGKGSIIALYASTEAAIYLLNSKRSDLADIEARYGVSVEVVPEGENEGAKMRVTSSGPKPEFVPVFEPIVEYDEDDEDEADIEAVEDEDSDSEGETETEASNEGEGDGGPRRKRRRRGRGRGRDRDRDRENATEDANVSANENDGESDETPEVAGDAEAEDEDGGTAKKRRRRGGRRRRGRGHSNEADTPVDAETPNSSDEATTAQNGASVQEPVSATTEASDNAESEQPEETPKPRSRRRKKVEESVAAVEETPADTGDAEEAVAKPKRTRRKKAVSEPTEGNEPASEAESSEPVEPAKPKRTRRKKADVDAAAPAADAPEKPKRTRRKKVEVASEPAETSVEAESQNTPETVPEREPGRKPSRRSDRVSEAAAVDGDKGEVETAGESDSSSTPRRGWWQRTFGE